MRKFIMALLGIILACSMSIPVLASPSDPTGWQNNNIYDALEDTVYDSWGYPLSDADKEHLWIYGWNPQDNFYLVLVKYPNNLNYYYGSNPVLSGDTIFFSSGYTMLTYTSGPSSYSTMGNYTVTVNENTQILGYYNDIVSGEVADPSIPNFTGGIHTNLNEYVSSPNIPLSIVYNKLSNIDTTDYTRYRLEVKARFAIPTEITVSKVNRQLQYDYSGYMWTNFENIWTYTDNIHLSLATYNSYKASLPGTLSSWTTLFNNAIDPSNFSVHFNYNDTAINKNAIIAQLTGFNLPMAGVDPNKFDIYVRFCEVDNGVIKYGRWTHYTNSNIEVVKTPADTIQDIPIQLPTAVSVLDDDQVSDQINNNLPDPYIIPDININNTVNYPDQNTLNYPTITTYNQDELLKYAIDTSKQLPSLFENITAFCQIAFSFIPAEIWAIIGFGFALSIVVMFMKIL